MIDLRTVGMWSLSEIYLRKVIGFEAEESSKLDVSGREAITFQEIISSLTI